MCVMHTADSNILFPKTSKDGFLLLITTSHLFVVIEFSFSFSSSNQSKKCCTHCRYQSRHCVSCTFLMRADCRTLSWFTYCKLTLGAPVFSYTNQHSRMSKSYYVFGGISLPLYRDISWYIFVSHLVN